MEIQIKVPTKEEIFKKGILIKVAGIKESWEQSQLNQYAKKSGFYIHHCNREIVYIGIAIKGKWGNFAERLRREFQYSASQNNSLHQLLCKQANPIMVSCYDFEEIEKMFVCSLHLPPARKALIMEHILIDLYQPPGNKKDKNL